MFYGQLLNETLRGALSLATKEKFNE